MKSNVGSVGIILDGEKILLMHRINNGKEYYTFIGGHKEGEETPEETLIREVREESSINIKPEKLLYRLGTEDGFVNYFLCKYISGTPKLGNDSIESEKIKRGNQSYEPVWVSIAELPLMLVYPLEVKDWFLKDKEDNFNDAFEEIIIEKEDRRQMI